MMKRFFVLMTGLGLVATLGSGTEASDLQAAVTPATPTELLQLFRENSPKQINLALAEGEDGTISGVHRMVGSLLYFSGKAEGNEEAWVKFWTEDGTLELESRIASAQEGWLVLAGRRIDGRGAIEDEAAELLDGLARSVVGEQLALTPLEAGCQVSAAKSAPLLAALVQPWQILYKHTGLLAADLSTLRLSKGCSYASPTPSRLMHLGSMDPIAYVPGFQTLDAEGVPLQVITALSTAPCGAKCRGACGADCSSPLCDSGSSGCVYQCPTHSFCRWHDGCYDGCNGSFGCGSINAWLCRRGCDEQCLQQYSATTCVEWANGFGPSDGWGTYNECSGGTGGSDPNDPGDPDGTIEGGCSITETCVDCPMANCDYCVCPP